MTGVVGCKALQAFAACVCQRPNLWLSMFEIVPMCEIVSMCGSKVAVPYPPSMQNDFPHAPGLESSMVVRPRDEHASLYACAPLEVLVPPGSARRIAGLYPEAMELGKPLDQNPSCTYHLAPAS